MNKQTKRLLVLLLILVVLAGVCFGLQKYNAAQSEAQEVTGEIVVDVPQEDIVRLSYEFEGETITLEKEEDTWYYAEDHAWNVTQDSVTRMLSAIAPLEAQQTIEKVTDMEQYGLAEDTRIISFETASETYTVEVGDYNSVSGIYYLRKSGEDTVYAVAKAKVTVFDKALEDIAELPEETTEETDGEATEEIEEAEVTEEAETSETEDAEATGEIGTTEITEEMEPTEETVEAE